MSVHFLRPLNSTAACRELGLAVLTDRRDDKANDDRSLGRRLHHHAQEELDTMNTSLRDVRDPRDRQRTCIQTFLGVTRISNAPDRRVPTEISCTMPVIVRVVGHASAIYYFISSRKVGDSETGLGPPRNTRYLYPTYVTGGSVAASRPTRNTRPTTPRSTRSGHVSKPQTSPRVSHGWRTSRRRLLGHPTSL